LRANLVKKPQARPEHLSASLILLLLSFMARYNYAMQQNNTAAGRRMILPIFTGLLLLTGGARLSYALWGHALIRAIYEGRAGWLNAVITPASNMPLRHYLELADRQISGAAVLGCLSAFAFLIAAVFLRHRFVKTIAVLTLLYALLLAWNASSFRLWAFERRAGEVLKRAEGLLSRAGEFNSKDALAALGKSGPNGFFYRFDDKLPSARVVGGSRPALSCASPSGKSFEFEDGSSAPFTLRDGRAVVEDGALSFDYTRGDVLSNTEDLDLDPVALDEIAFRIKLDSGDRMVLFWDKYRLAEKAENWPGKLTINVIPDGKFHVYRVRIEHLFNNFIGTGDRIHRFSITPSNAPNDRIRIDYIRFNARPDRYLREPFGRTHEEIGREMRSCLYQSVPLALTYRMTLPENPASMRFGMGILENGRPVTFEITLDSGASRETVFSQTVHSAVGWTDAEIDLSKWRGREAEITLAVRGQSGNTAFWSNPAAFAPPEKRMNVIVILEDALRADHVSGYGYRRKTTPFKDRLFSQGALFRHAFSQAPETRPSVTSMMTSLYPTATGVWSTSDTLGRKYLTLAEILRHQGFVTGSFIQNDHAGPYSGLHEGFGRLRDAGSLGFDRTAGLFGQELDAWISANRDRNFFLYLHLINPHGIYDPPAPFDAWYREKPVDGPALDRFVMADPDWVKIPTPGGRIRLYDGEILENDHYLERFVRGLENLGLLEHTLLVFIADHGEHLGKYGLWGHRPPGYLRVLNVPMVMVFPGVIPAGRSVTETVQLLDLMPTILDLAGIPRDGLMLQGDSLLPLLGGRPQRRKDRIVYSEETTIQNRKQPKPWASVFFGKWHALHTKALEDPLARTARHLNRFLNEQLFGLRVFDYRSDPGESRWMNRFTFDGLLKNRLTDFINRLTDVNTRINRCMTEGAEDNIRMNPEQLKRLRALGYLH